MSRLCHRSKLKLQCFRRCRDSGSRRLLPIIPREHSATNGLGRNEIFAAPRGIIDDVAIAVCLGRVDGFSQV
jgi:hypothetical protein